MARFIKGEISRAGDVNPDYILFDHDQETIKISFMPNGNEFILKCSGLSQDGYGRNYLTYFQSFENFVYETTESKNNTFCKMYRHDVYTFDDSVSDTVKTWIKENVTEISQDWGAIGDLITKIFRSYLNGDFAFTNN